MTKKYEIVAEMVHPDYSKLHRIRALVDVSDEVKAGQLGGYIEREDNLSHLGKCWVFDDACVMANATVFVNACIRNFACLDGSAIVRDNAVISGYACVRGNASVRDSATVSGNAKVRCCAIVLGSATITDSAVVDEFASVAGNATIKDHAQIGGDATVSGYVTVSDFARVLGHADCRGCCVITDSAVVTDKAVVRGPVGYTDYNAHCVYIGGKAQVMNDARVTGSAVIKSCENVIGNADSDLLADKAASIYAQTLHCCLDGKVVLYKSVRRVPGVEGEFASIYDSEFRYKIGHIAEAKDCNNDATKSCTSGLHCSYLRYWDDNGGDAYIAVEVDLDDVIAVQGGKVRCKKLKVLCEVRANGTSV